jgi:XTP/dITP diphosphohydrolase
VKLLLATTSAGKVREQRAALEDLDIDVEIVTLEAWPELTPPFEPGPHFRDNARAKALEYHLATGLPALGEDSGLEVDALGGEPGIHSARWLGEGAPYEAKNARLIERLEGVADAERTARYVSALALVEDGRVVFETEATCEGRITREPAGTGGFGYDPIFFFSAYGKTLAQVSPEEKNRVSHRGKAMAALRRFLSSRAEEH